MMKMTLEEMMDEIIQNDKIWPVFRRGIVLGWVVFFFACAMSLVVMAFRPRPDIQPKDALHEVRELQRSIDTLHSQVGNLRDTQRALIISTRQDEDEAE